MQTTYEKKRYCVNLGSMAGSTGSWNSSPRLAMLPAIIQTSVPDLFGHALEPATLFADLQCFVGLGVEGAIRRPHQAPAPGRKLRLELRALHPRPGLSRRVREIVVRPHGKLRAMVVQASDPPLTEP